MTRKPYFTDLMIFAGLLLITGCTWLLTGDIVDIQLYDTYVIIPKLYIIILILGPITFSIFFIRALANKFKSAGANTGLIIGLLLLATIIYNIIQFQEIFLDELSKTSNESIPLRAQSVHKQTNRLYITWGLLSLCIASITLLSMKTIKNIRR